MFEPELTFKARAAVMVVVVLVAVVTVYITVPVEGNIKGVGTSGWSLSMVN